MLHSSYANIMSVSSEKQSIGWFIEDKAFLLSYDLAPRPHPPPSLVSKLVLFLSLPVCRRSSLVTGEGVSGGQG